MTELNDTVINTEASLVAQRVKNLPAIRETWVQSLGWEDPLEKGAATYSSNLAWRIPWTVHGVAKSRTQLSDFHFHLSLKSKLSGKSEQLEATQKISKKLKPRSVSFGLFMPVHLL